MKRQDENAIEFIKQKGWTLVATYDDKGISAYSGKNRKEGELARILNLIRTGVIKPGEIIVVDALDRLTRQPPLEAFSLLKEILEAGIAIQCVYEREPFTYDNVNSNMGMAIGMLTSMMRAHDESAHKSRLVRQAYQNGRESGEIVAGRCPTWLVRNQDRKTGRKWFEVNEDVLPIIKRMFEMSAAGHSSYEICARFQAEGIPPLGEQRRRAGSTATNKHRWNATSVQDIVRGRAVLGEFKSHRVWEEEGKRRQKLMAVLPNYYPEVIEPELWERANRALRDRNKRKIRGNTGIGFPNLLKPIATCAHCGSSMHVKNQRENNASKAKYRRLRCAGRTEGTCDNARSPRYDAIEEAILMFVREVKVADQRSDERATLSRLVSDDTMQIDALKHQVRNIITSFSGSAMAVEIAAEKEAEIAVLTKSLQSNQAKLAALNFATSPEDRQSAMRALIDKMSTETDEKRLYDIRVELNLRLRETIKTMKFDHNGEITVYLHDNKARYFFQDAAKGEKVDGIRIKRPVLGQMIDRPEVY